MKFIDTNVWFGSWPFIPSIKYGPKAKRGSQGIDITEVLISSFDTVFQVDPMPGNRTLFENLKPATSFRPLPVINPATTAWEDHLKEVSEDPRVVGVRLLPAYHGYRLNSVAVGKLAKQIEEKGLRLIITARLVDERHEHQAVSIKPVAVSQLATFIGKHPKLHPLIQGLSIHELKTLSAEKGLFSTDTSFAEWEDTLKVLKGHLPISRILFGSLSPLQVMQAQVDKVRLSSLSARQREAVANGNAQKYFKL